MAYDLIRQYERELVILLREEYSFYQSLYITLDKQRDQVQFDKDENLVSLFNEIRRCSQRIKESEAKITEMRQRDPVAFEEASALPEIKKIVNSIATLLKKNMRLVSETEKYLRDRYDRIKVELGELKNSTKILQYLGHVDSSPQFIDGKQ